MTFQLTPDQQTRIETLAHKRGYPSATDYVLALIEADAENLYDPNVTSEQQPDGTNLWYATHPTTGERVEIDPDQRWYWTAAWQAKEREADEDIKAGRYEEFDNFDDFINSLPNLKANAMIYRRLQSFNDDFADLPKEIQNQAKNKFQLFRKNRSHPSLRVKKMQGHTNRWEGHITREYVFTFEEVTDEKTGELLILFRRVGTHDIYDNP